MSIDKELIGNIATIAASIVAFMRVGIEGMEEIRELLEQAREATPEERERLLEVISKRSGEHSDILKEIEDTLKAKGSASDVS